MLYFGVANINCLRIITYMQEKIKKTLYIPPWTGRLLDDEGERYDGPGVVAAAAIYNFCTLDHDAQIAALEAFRSQEIKLVYAEGEGHASGAALFDEVAEAVRRDKRGTRILIGPESEALGKLIAELGPEYIAKVQADVIVSGAEAAAKAPRRKKPPGASKSA